MNISYRPYTGVPQLSGKDQDYIALKPYLKDFYNYTPTLASFADAIKDRAQYPVDRQLLHRVVSGSYDTFQPSALQQTHIAALANDRTYTVITAHQPSLLGGPLYYIFKISSALNLVQQLQKEYPDHHFVPVFINGSEDHDFEEVDHFSIFGKTVKWDRDAKGPVGRLSTDGLSAVIDQTAAILGSGEHKDELMGIFGDALAAADSYNDFVFQYVNRLFADKGLLVVNTDNADLKRNFIPLMERELTERASESIILQTQQDLEHHGFKSQAFPRDINLFYLGNGDRQRITFDDNHYHIVDTNEKYTEKQILEILHERPQDFSPNVVMRPIYQEYSLPNLAYIGGGGEIAYWLERKAQFANYKVYYPMLIRRNSAMLLDKSNQGTLAKLGLTVQDIFAHEDQVISDFLLGTVSQDISIENELQQLQQAYESIATKAAPHDPGLEKAILAEMTKQAKQVSNLGSRIKRAIKSREETNVNKIRKVKDKLFPSNGLQERSDNFIQYYGNHGSELIDFLVDNMDPLRREFAIIEL